MAQPRPYERDYDFTSFQVRHATTPPPGNKLDAEFDQIAATIEEVLSRIKDLQRDDLQLANSLVGYDQLKPELRNGFTTPTVWKTATNYAIGASIYVGPKLYAALAAHTSGVFATDMAAGKWHLLADFTIVAGAVQTAVDSAAAAVVSATEAAASAFTASTAAMNAQALLDTIDVNDVTTLAAISADITAAVANATDISTVAGIVSDIPAVAGVAADVATVAGIAADVTAAAANMAAIIAAPDAADAAAASAQTAADIAATLAGVVVGPASSVDSRLVAFDGTTGKLVKDSGVLTSAVVTLTGTQTLTGKTLTSPDINTPAIVGGSFTGGTDITVADGGTGRSSHTAFGVIAGGATTTGPQQSIAVGTVDHVLTSNGAGALPSFQALPAAVTPNYGAGNAALSRGSVGRDALMKKTAAGTLAAGATISGGSLEYAAIQSAGGVSSASSPSGTWRNEGPALTQNESTTFLRIS